jgi:predicted DNA-binding transcriptional regulator AlpA
MASTDDLPPDRYLTEQDLLEEYLIPPRTAQRWRSEGRGPKWIRLGRRRVIYRRSDVEIWLAERTFSSRADELARSMAAITSD